MTPEFGEVLAEFSNRFHDWIYFAFPWGEGELTNAAGPEPWQAKLAIEVDNGLSPHDALLLATTSGHGIGKSTFVSWLILWALSTKIDTRGVVTANTEVQLKTKTWAELAKWYRLFIFRDMFRYEATCIFSRDREHEKTWRIDMVPWSERNTEAFAGLHNQGRRILVIFDEASAIPDAIWETTEGALTDQNTEIIWAVFGNPTRNTGRFKSCFPGGQFSHRWSSRAVDSREVSFTDKAQIQRWIDDYGFDSDFCRIRIRGIFPRTGTGQFFPSPLVAAARTREAVAHLHDPLILGVDVARFGDNRSVIAVRKGRDARTIPWESFLGIDTMTLASRVAELNLALSADAIFVDGGGVGGGVVDRCRQLGVPVFEVQFGGRADRSDVHAEQTKYFNKRAEMYGYCRDWLPFGSIPDDQELAEDLISIEAIYNETKDLVQLVGKESMRKLGLRSPDFSDALVLTFAWPVTPSAFAGREGPKKSMIQHEYDPFDLKELAA